MYKRLYRLDIPDQALTRSNASTSRQVATQGVLGGGQGVVDPISTDPGQIVLDGQLRGKYAGLMATEIEEVFSADLDSVAYYAVDGAASTDGYYALENIGKGPLDPRADSIQEFDGRLRFIGSRSSHYRELDFEPTKTDYPGANEQTCEVGVPAAATWTSWMNAVTGETSPATAAATRTAEYGDVDVFDASPGSTPFDNSVLVYDQPYSAEGMVDVGVWDNHGRAKFDSEGICSWQRVFLTAHDPDGSLVLDNGLLRVTLDTQGGLGAEEHDPSQGAWTTLSLPSSDWTLQDVDVRDIRPARVATKLVFANTASGDTYPLRGLLHRGRTRLQFDRTEASTTGVPVGLEDYLAPLAGGSLYDAGASLGLRDRGEVNA